MNARGGLTLIEIVVAVAIIGVLFAGLAYLQVTSVRGSATSRFAADAKGEANRVLERVVEDVVKVDTSTDPDTFYFKAYYDACGPDADARGDQCEGSIAADGLAGFEPDPNIATSWFIGPVMGSAIEQEGVLTIAVTSQHARGAAITLGSAISCYDVYPSPTAAAPVPCPEPANP